MIPAARRVRAPRRSRAGSRRSTSAPVTGSAGARRRDPPRRARRRGARGFAPAPPALRTWGGRRGVRAGGGWRARRRRGRRSRVRWRSRVASMAWFQQCYPTDPQRVACRSRTHLPKLAAIAGLAAPGQFPEPTRTPASPDISARNAAMRAYKEASPMGGREAGPGGVAQAAVGARRNIASPKQPPTLVAMGGNSLLDPTRPPTVENQFAVTARAVVPIAALIEAGEHLVLTHGNGPQGGFMQLRGELAKSQMHDVALDSLVADSQGAIGYMIQRDLREELERRGVRAEVVTIVTEVEVDPEDEAFAEPTKPAGRFYTAAEAERLPPRPGRRGRGRPGGRGVRRADEAGGALLHRRRGRAARRRARLADGRRLASRLAARRPLARAHRGGPARDHPPARGRGRHGDRVRRGRDPGRARSRRAPARARGGRGQRPRERAPRRGAGHLAPRDHDRGGRCLARLPDEPPHAARTHHGDGASAPRAAPPHTGEGAPAPRRGGTVPARQHGSQGRGRAPIPRARRRRGRDLHSRCPPRGLRRASGHHHSKGLTEMNASETLTRLDAERLAALHGRSLLLTRDWHTDELDALLGVAARFEALDRGRRSTALLPDELAYALFFDNSTRTKSAWAGAAARLGMRPVIVDGGSTQVEHGETAEETGAMLGMNAHALGIRHDLILGEGNRFMGAVKQGIDDYLATQTLADLMWLRERFPDGLQGRKIAVSWAYSPSYAKPLSVPQGLAMLLTRYGAEVVLAHQEGYRLTEDTLATARTHAERSGGSFRVTSSMEDAFTGADAVYPKSWGPYDLMLDRVAANRDHDGAKMAAIERKALERNAGHRDWICDERRMGLTRNGRALSLPCLPADIGAEVSPGVMEAQRMNVARQANKKLYVVMALLAIGRVPDLAARLRGLER